MLTIVETDAEDAWRVLQGRQQRYIGKCERFTLERGLDSATGDMREHVVYHTLCQWANLIPIEHPTTNCAIFMLERNELHALLLSTFPRQGS